TQMRKDYGPGVRPLWPVDKAQLKVGAWPQYYIGAYPYCFRLPEYKEQTWPPAKPAPTMAGMNMPSDDDAGALMMGQSPGTHWYHAHKHGSTTIDVSNGMTGAFIIEGPYDDYLNDQYKAYGPQWTRRQPVLVINQLGTTPNLMKAQGQDRGNDFSINGRINPVITMAPGEVQLWRIVNSASRGGVLFDEGPPHGFQWRILARDGVQLKDVNYQKTANQKFLLA